MFSIFKKKTREEQVMDKTEKVFALLVNDAEFDFTDLETVQVLNNVRRKLNESLMEKKALLQEQAVSCGQKANEVENVLRYIE